MTGICQIVYTGHRHQSSLLIQSIDLLCITSGLSDFANSLVSVDLGGACDQADLAATIFDLRVRAAWADIISSFRLERALGQQAAGKPLHLLERRYALLGRVLPLRPSHCHLVGHQWGQAQMTRAHRRELRHLARAGNRASPYSSSWRRAGPSSTSCINPATAWRRPIASESSTQRLR